MDQARCSEIVCEACARAPRSRPVGLWTKDENVIVCLEAMEEVADYSPEAGVLPVPDPSEDGILAEIKSRYYAGFSMIGFFETDHAAWGLFGKKSLK